MSAISTRLQLVACCFLGLWLMPVVMQRPQGNRRGKADCLECHSMPRL